MTSVYDLVAQTRPRIRRDTLFTKTPEGVLFHNASGGFRVDARSAYQYASLLVPHFNGRNLVADICRSLGQPQREMVGALVKALYDRGFARDVPPDADAADLPAEVATRFAEQIAYIDHYVDQPASRFARFRGSRVAVLGTGPVARWCASSLIRNGCAHVAVTAGIGDGPGTDELDTDELDADRPGADGLAEVRAEAAELTAAGCPVEIAVRTPTPALADWADLTGYDFVIVAAGARAPAQTLRLRAAGVPAGTALIPAWTLGARAIVGPLTAAGSSACWVCAALRLGGNADGDAAAELWKRVSLPDSGPALGQPTGAAAAMLGNLLGYEVFKLATGALPPETAGQVVIQNLDSFDVVAETLLPHPGCPHCAAQRSAADADGTQLRELRELPAAGLRDLVPDAPVAADGPAAEVDAAADALVAELDERMVLFGRQAGVFTRYTDEPWTQLPLMVSTIRLALPAVGRREIAAFDVHSVAGARRRALHAAAGVYAEHVRGGAAATPRPGLPRVDPARLSIASGVGAPVEGDHLWRTAVSLLTGDPLLVPTAAVYPFGPENHAAVVTPTRAGIGAGASLVEAVQQGLLSALCYPALLRAMRGAGGVARIALDALDGSPELAFLAKAARNIGIEAELLDLGAGPTGAGAGAGLADARPAGAAHVLLARAEDPRTGTAGWRIAAHPSWAQAAVAALRDLLGWVQLGRQITDGRPVDDGDPLLADLDPATLAVATESPARLDARTGMGEILDGLRAGGQDALVVQTTPPDLRAGGLATVRVLLAAPDQA